jgi:hypothetical protein
MKLKVSTLAIFLVSLGINFSFFATKSFYPYILSFKVHSQLIDYLPNETSVNAFKGSISNPWIATYIDTVSLEKRSQLQFSGRNFTENPIDMARLENQLKQSVSDKFLAELTPIICTGILHPDQNNFLEEAPKLVKNREICVSKINSQITGHVEILDLDVKDAGRAKKILFVSMVVSVFFAAAFYLFAPLISLTS